MDKTSYWDRFRRQRISRRRMLAATGVGAAGLVIAAACDDDEGGEPSDGTSVPSGTPQPGGRYKEATSVISDATFGLDPHLAVANGLAYFARTYNVLMNRSAVDDTFIQYDLAESFEHPDDTTYIFNLRTNVMIPENNLDVPSRAMDASDAVATFERIKAQPLANSCQFVCQYFASHEATSPTVYTVRTTKPYAWFEFNIGRAISTIPPKEFLESSKLTSASVGGGQHQLVLVRGAVDEDHALALEEPGDGARLAEVAVALRERGADVGCGAVPVVGESLQVERDAAGAVALVGDGLISRRIGARPGALGDRAFDVVPRHRVFARLLDRVLEREVAGRVGTSVARGDDDRPRQLGEELAPLGVGRPLLALDRCPLAMTGQGSPP